MRPLALAGTAAALLVLTGCVAAAPGATSAPLPPETSAPAAPGTHLEPGAEAQARLADLPLPTTDGEVLAIGSVLQADGAAMLCDMMLASYPPQCAGPEIIGWDWSSAEHEEASGVRWTDASIAFRATYDAAASTLTPVEMLDLAALSMPAYEEPTGTIDQATSTAIQADFNAALDRVDVRGSGAGPDVTTLEVVYDDGSMQAFLDDLYGPGAVVVVSWLR